ncbi:hypothetical protein AAFF_G00238500 [Aldrovandia affinis]|uniref:SH2 domain-containing protein n=1 Tax=Aldrovandia affinis TaxID=143900 RepID=A0AAD7W3N8_9TELE|nr:hypothetical protein AAFF_G00238500 [Aldrovandia affinis]
MAKWLKDYLSFGSRRVPPQPPKPDYTESEILKAYRLQKNLDFEDPYENFENRTRNGSVMSEAPFGGSPLKSAGGTLDLKSPKHRLIKVESQDLGRTKILLSAVSFEEPEPPVVPSAPEAGDLDYSDPFDARPDPWAAADPDPVVPEGSSYMEPYEAQRLLTQLQLGQTGVRARGDVQLYDTPYEERERVAGVAGAWPLRRSGREGVAGAWSLRRSGREGVAGARSPMRSVRAGCPRTTSGQQTSTTSPGSGRRTTSPRPSQCSLTEGSGGDRGSRRSGAPPGPARRREGEEEGGGGSVRFRKAPEPHCMLGERVDPARPLEKQVWFHGALTRSEAESLLTLCKECSYLVRHSQTSHTDFSLSLRSCQGFMHMKFSKSRDGQYILGQNSPPFDTIPQVIHYYTTHKLPIRGAEHLSLLFPVVVQTL